MDMDDHIDSLLQRYLGLLNEYTNLREELSSLQKSMYQDIARANFSAERGLRYGQDHYDERMQALRHVGISSEATPVFSIENPPKTTESKPETAAEAKGENEEEPKDQDGDESEKKQSEKVVNKDPLKWFGFVTPSALRNAQASSVKAIETIIPRLASVNAEMMGVEIEIRRARKKRSKAQTATPVTVS